MNLVLVGPTYPYRGGISHYTTLLYRALSQQHDVRIFSFAWQYPRWLFPGKSDRDPSRMPLQADALYPLTPLTPSSWWRTAAAIVAYRPTAVIIAWWHPYWAPSFGVLARLLRRADVRVYYICHNILPHERHWWDGLPVQFALSPAEACIVHSHADAQALQQILPQMPVYTSFLPTYRDLANTTQKSNDEKNDNMRSNLGLPPGKPVVLFFGLVRAYKGLPILLQALAQTPLPLHLLVVGEFWEPVEDCWAKIRMLGLGEKVTVINEYVPNEDIASYFHVADVLVAPYLEASQSAVIQLALGLGVPVIASAVGGIPDVIEDEVNGLLVPPNDPTALSQALQRYFNESWSTRLRTQIQKDQETYSWGNAVRFIEELIATRAQTSG